MGKIIFSTRNFYDSTVEYIGIKSGLLLSRFQIREILIEQHSDDFLIEDDLDMFIRIYADELEEMFLTIRKKIGNLPSVSSTESDYKIVANFVRKTNNIEYLSRSTGICLHYIRENPNITNFELAKLLEEKENYPHEISLPIANIGLERNDQSCIIYPSSKSWDGFGKLSDLYECEITSEDENEFLDQKFLDYLAINGHEIEKIHWRNFEKFCAEYFKKQGRKVILGPGTNDGGIDIRIFDPKKIEKPLIVIQCKRYSKENKVSIETVKAFYTDVVFEHATKGLIATSSYIASDGKKVRDARGYNIDFAEFNNVRSWAKEMWTFNKK